MGLMKKIVFLVIAVMSAALITQPAFSATSSMPWLNFGNNLLWDSNSMTLSNDGMTQVTSVTYGNGSSATPTSFLSPPDPILGVFNYSPPDTFNFYNVMVDFSISFDTDSTNDYLRLVSTDGSGIVWLDAQLDVTGPAIDPLTSNAPYTFGIEASGLTVANGMGSQWANEFDALAYNNAAQLSIVSRGPNMDMGNGIYKVNAFSKVSVAVVPEPMSYILFIAGACALSTRRYWMKRKCTS